MFEEYSVFSETSISCFMGLTPMNYEYRSLHGLGLGRQVNLVLISGGVKSFCLRHIKTGRGPA